MIIKEVLIENYLCYYGIKKFSLSKGLNIILGENGEGKTKFFEALDWLLNGDNDNLDKLVSKKALAENSNDMEKAAKSLGMKSDSLIRKLKKLALTPDSEDDSLTRKTDIEEDNEV